MTHIDDFQGDHTPEPKKKKWFIVVLPALISLLALSMVFLGGYLTGVHLERQTSTVRIGQLSTEVSECNRTLEQWCSGSRIRAGSCNGEMHMCICAGEEDVKNFEF